MKSIIHTLVLGFIVVLLLGCESKVTQDLRIGISPWPGYEPLVLAVEKGLFKDTNIRIIRFASPTESFKALRDGAVDVAAFTADEVLHYAEVRDGPKVFLVLDISNGGDAIVAKPGIESLDDLKGKCIASEPSALGEYVINRALDFTDKVTIEEVSLKPVSIGDQLQAYQKGEADVFVTYEPSKTKLINAGAKVLFDSTQIPYEIIDVFVVNEHTLEQKSTLLKKTVEVWFEAQRYINENWNESMALMAGYEGLKQEEFEAAYKALLIPTLQENYTVLGSGEGSMQQPLQKLAKLMRSNGCISTVFSLDELMTPSMLPEK